MSCNKRLKTDGGTLQPSAATGAGGVDFSGGNRGPEPRPLVGAVGRGVDALSADVLPLVFGFLGWRDILRARVCRRWREAATCTDVPPTSRRHCTLWRFGRFYYDVSPDTPGVWKSHSEFRVWSVRTYNIMVGLTRVLPNLQQLELSPMDAWHKFEDGENPTADRYPARRQEIQYYDVGVIGAFRNLRHLYLVRDPLNGRYPVVFNFARLQTLHIEKNKRLKWEIGMLAGTPQLKELIYSEEWDPKPEEPLTGDIASFSVVKESLEKLKLDCCRGISGDYRGLADFPCLKVLETLNAPVTGCLGGESPGWIRPGSFPNLEVLELGNAQVTGDLRRLQVQHFPKLRSLSFGCWHDFFGFDDLERIEDAAEVMQSLYPLMKRSPSPFPADDCVDSVPHKWYLSIGSPDRYEALPKKTSPPFIIVLVQAGPRLGWQWINSDYDNISGCEVNWLDPEPCENADEYAKYTKELERIQKRINVYKGFYRPPTQEEYKRVCGDFYPDWMQARDIRF